MTKRTAYEDMAAALEKAKRELDADSECLFCYEPKDSHVDDCPTPDIEAALARAKKVPVEVGMFGTHAPEDVVYQRIFSGCPTPPREEDVAEAKRASEGHPPDCVCCFCACLRKLKGRGTL